LVFNANYLAKIQIIDGRITIFSLLYRYMVVWHEICKNIIDTFGNRLYGLLVV